MAKAGRKSLAEEYKILDRYADLTPLVFSIINNLVGMRGFEPHLRVWEPADHTVPQAHLTP